MKRKIDAVVKEEVDTDLKDEDEDGCADPKKVPSLEEVHDPDSLEEDYDESLEEVHDPDSLEEDDDEEYERIAKGSVARHMFEFLMLQDLASRLKADSEVVDLSEKILKHIKDGNHDVESFSGMVNQVLKNKSFCEELRREGVVKERIWYVFMAVGTKTERINLGDADLLSVIKKDNLFRFAAQEFFKETLEKGEVEVVRGALCILFPFCMTASYMEENGFWDDSYFDCTFPPRPSPFVPKEKGGLM